MTKARVRLTAAERREQIIAAALGRFAHGGLHGTSTEDIAADTGLSQPYLFRLFKTKRELFLACCEVCNARVRQAFAEACEGDTPQERLESMGRAHTALIADATLLGFQLQMYAACGDPVIRERSRELYRTLANEVRARSGAGDEELFRFFATGMMLNIVTTLGLGDVLKHT